MRLSPRTFLRLLPLLAAAPLAAQAPAAPAPAASTPAAAIALRGSFRGPLGLQLYSVRDAMKADVPGTLARVRALGVREVELAGTNGMSAADFRAALDRAGLRATSMHVGYERLRDSLDAVLDEARTLGATYLGVAWIPHPDGPFTPDMARAAAADFSRWGRAARGRGLRFFYHIHGYEFRPGPGGVLPMDVLMRETRAADVAFELDTFWAARPGVDPAALLRKHPGRWALMHLKGLRDGASTGDHSGQNAPPDETESSVGAGQIDFRAVLRAARASGVRRYYLEDERSTVFTTLPESVAWLERVRF